MYTSVNVDTILLYVPNLCKSIQTQIVLVVLKYIYLTNMQPAYFFA